MVYLEVWKDITGYEKLYEVSNYGGIRSKDRTYTDKRGFKRKKTGRTLKNRSKKYYYTVMLYKDGSRKAEYLHRLIAAAFLPKVTGKDFINHLDGNKLNNHVDNLEWCTIKENNLHAIENGLNNKRHKVLLTDRETGKQLIFESKTAASLFLGRRENYVSAIIKKGRSGTDKYIIKSIKTA